MPRDDARRFPAAPYALDAGGEVRGGCAQPPRQPARIQQRPGSAFAGLAPRVLVLRPPTGHCNPRAMRRAGESHSTIAILWHYYRTCARLPLSPRPSAVDIPGDNVVQLIRDDQPVLAPLGGEIRHREEPILLLAAADRATLEDAAGHIRIQYEAAEPIYALEQATEVFSTVEIRKGEVLEDLKGGEDVEVVERTFRVGLQEQLYIEPQGAIAIPYRDLGSGARGSGVTVIASLQCPYYVHRALKRV